MTCTLSVCKRFWFPRFFFSALHFFRGGRPLWHYDVDSGGGPFFIVFSYYHTIKKKIIIITIYVSIITHVLTVATLFYADIDSVRFPSGEYTINVPVSFTRHTFFREKAIRFMTRALTGVVTYVQTRFLITFSIIPRQLSPHCVRDTTFFYL